MLFHLCYSLCFYLPYVFRVETVVSSNQGIANNGSHNVSNAQNQQTVGTSVFAVSGIPSTVAPSSGVSMRLTNGSLVPGLSVIPSTAGAHRTMANRGQSSVSGDSIPLSEPHLVGSSEPVETVSKASPSSVSQGNRGADSLFGIVARPSNWPVQDNLSSNAVSVPSSAVGGNSSPLRHSSAVITQPGRTASPVSTVQMVDRSRSMTPPSAVSIDRGGPGERSELTPGRRQLFGGVRAGSEVQQSADTTAPSVHRMRNDLTTNVGSFSNRPSSAGSGGVGQYTGIENGDRLGTNVRVGSPRVPPLSETIYR